MFDEYNYQIGLASMPNAPNLNQIDLLKSYGVVPSLQNLSQSESAEVRITYPGATYLCAGLLLCSGIYFLSQKKKPQDRQTSTKSSLQML